MRVILVGIEYAGKSTLIGMLDEYYRRRNVRTHVDDHFTIPDSTLSDGSRKVLVGLPDDMKERYQRMQFDYHIDILRDEPFSFLGGWHIEEAIYIEFYGGDPESFYHKQTHINLPSLEIKVFNLHLSDVIMVHVTASDEAISQRMSTDPHEFQVIKESDIPRLKARFDEEVGKSLFAERCRTIVLDTTDKTPQQSFDELLLASEPYITPGELAVRSILIPEGKTEVRYENGVRKVVADSR